MKVLFGLFTILLTAAFFVTGVVYLIARTIGQIAWNPESKAFKRLLESLRAHLKKHSANLVPWDHEMLSLLSLNRINEKKPGWFNPISSGQITTIYQEPVLSYVTQSTGKVQLILARTSSREFIFRKKGNETEIWLDGQPFGLFVDGALLAPGKGSRLMARLDDRLDEAQSPLVLGNTTAVTLGNPGRKAGPNPRALTLLRELTPEEENTALAMAVLKIGL
jgi:hypothetical protein